METVTLNVQGMSCEHCVRAIKNAVNAIDGVSNVDVSLATNTATVTYNPKSAGLLQIREAIEEEGYEVV